MYRQTVHQIYEIITTLNLRAFNKL